MIFESVWLAGECAGPPDTMLYFNETQTTPFYSLVSDVFKAPICGLNPLLMYRGCCEVSLYTDFKSSPYLSGTHSIGNVFDYPVTANEAKYCQIKGDGYNFDGMNSIWILANGKCNANKLICHPSGQLEIFDNANCSNLIQAEILTSSTQKINSSAVGQFSGALTTVVGGTLTYQWTAYVPVTILVPQNHLPLLPIEWFAIITLGLSFLILSHQVFIYAQLFYRASKKLMPIRLISYIFYLGWAILSLVWYQSITRWITVDPLRTPLLISSEFRQMFFNLASLLTAISTATFFIEVFRLDTQLKKYSFYSTIIVFHVITAGAYYVDYLKYVPQTEVFVTQWAQLVPVWVIFMYSFDTIPQFILAISVVRIEQYERVEQSIFISLARFVKQNPSYCLLVLVQFINFGCYILLAYLLNYSQALKNDKIIMAFCGPLVLVDSIHSIVNDSILQQLRKIVSKKASTKSDIFPASFALKSMMQ